MLKNVVVDYNPVAKVTEALFNKVSLLGKLSDYLHGLLCGKQENSLQNALFLLGVASLTYKTVSFAWQTLNSWKWLPGYLQRQQRLSASALKEKYGDCYVLITGFTEGIGYGFAQVLAEMGFNLLLVSRNEEKVARVGEQLRKQHPGVSIEYCACDLADKKQIGELETLLRKYEHLDIGIIINNAGSVAGGNYLTIDPQMLIDDANVDLVALYEINRILLPKLRVRRHRAAIVNIASCTGVFLSPNVGVYSCTKRSLDRYSQALDQENSDRVDVLSVRPFGVTTKMMKMKKGPFMITPRQCATSTLADLLGGEKLSFGHFKHWLSSIAFQKLSEEEALKLYDFLWQQARAQAQ